MAIVEMSSVIIPQEKIDQIKAAISQLEHHDLIFNKWGFATVFEKGTAVSLLFHGIPGTGKSMMAQAIADFLKYELVIISTADIETSEPGGAERKIREVFKQANTKVDSARAATSNPTSGYPTVKQQILLFDECDSLLNDRNSMGTILAAQVNALLTEIETFKGIIIFTTNRLGTLDAALERRITAKIEFEFPKKDQRAAIWRRMLPALAPLADNVDVDELSGFPMVGGNIKNAVLNAARMAAYKKQSHITREDFIKAIEDEMKALQEFLTSFQKDRRRRTGPQLAEDINRVKGGLQVADVEKVRQAELDTTKKHILMGGKGKVKTKIKIKTKVKRGPGRPKGSKNKPK